MPNFLNVKSLKIAILIVVIISSLFVIYFCIKQIMNQNKEEDTKIYTQSELQDKMVGQDSIRVWGSVPIDACGVFEREGLLTTPFEPIKGSANLWICSSPDVQIPNAKGIKTLRYEAQGFKTKVTNYRLILKVKDNNKLENKAAQSSWAIYTAVLLQRLFNISLTEKDMADLSNLTVGQSHTRFYDGKLRMTTNAEKVDGVSVYTFEVFGLPMVQVK